jgi:preprotein translocase subunit YajC
MKLRSAVLTAILAMAATVALAHGDQKHVVGTVEKISADAVVVKTNDGKSVEVKLASKTVYAQRDGTSAKLSDLAVGDRVVIHATSHGDTLEATDIKFAKPNSAAHAAAKPRKP